MRSIRAIRRISDIDMLFSSWADPYEGKDAALLAINNAADYVHKVHVCVREYGEGRIVNSLLPKMALILPDSISHNSFGTIECERNSEENRW